MNIEIFNQQPFPDDLPIAPTGLEQDGWVGQEAERFFKGKSIKDISYEALLMDYPYDISAIHNFLSRQAYLFFLPALLKISLENYSQGNVALLAEHLVTSFFRMAKGEHDDRLIPILNHYTRPQLGVIAEFLKAMSDRYYYPLEEDDDAANALKLFWGQYLPAE